jgi:hypothetical protein
MPILNGIEASKQLNKSGCAAYHPLPKRTPIRGCARYNLLRPVGVPAYHCNGPQINSHYLVAALRASGLCSRT